MARGVNKVILVGHVGQDPELKSLPSGSSVVNIGVATTESWNDAGGQRQERTEWHRVVMFNKLAEIASQYLRKGSQVYIEGSMRTNKWEKDGIQRQTTEVIARDMQMLGSKPGGQTGGYQNQPQSTPAAPQPATDLNDFDDDIPF